MFNITWEAVEQSSIPKYRGMLSTLRIIIKEEGVRSIYNGISPGLQRQMCFSVIKLGLYDEVKMRYTKLIYGGCVPNMVRNSIVNVGEIVTYDVIKDLLIMNKVMTDGVPCHLLSAAGAGFCATVVASPVDVVKTRFMNSPQGEYRGVFDCALSVWREGKLRAFYKGFVPSFMRVGSWNIVMFLSYEQLKKAIVKQLSITDEVEDYPFEGQDDAVMT
ncbi:hypothetical protein FSP39_011442 [Pinctada imbricata]|uniref:Uncharacterized protein n=1 Tax=Pinctada imbricata TaxID=66713 RepID=A0AA89BW90_PINIB|nr:hypothetical protein FSP39_011442 [Pinctada imbricata]